MMDIWVVLDKNEGSSHKMESHVHMTQRELMPRRIASWAVSMIAVQKKGMMAKCHTSNRI